MYKISGEDQDHELTPFKYDKSENNEDEGFKEGLVKIKLNDKFGFVNKAGKEVIPPKYEYVESFFEGLAEVTLYGYEGYIDITGTEYWEINPAEFKGRPKR